MDIRGVVEQWVEAFKNQDLESMAEILHPDFVEIYPQSGELIRGLENLQSIVSVYPGLPEGEVIKTSGGEPARTDVIPSPLPFGLPIIQVSDGEQSFTVESLMEYPSGDKYYGVSIGELKDGKVLKVTSYFAPPFEAPAWRAPFVEAIPE
jgi:hypothetical protein